MKNRYQILIFAIAALGMIGLAGCEDRHHHYGGWHGPHHWALTSDQDRGAPVPEQAAQLSADYGISQKSAQAFVDVAASENPVQDSAKLGVSAVELAPLAKAQMPNLDSINKVAAHLGEDPSNVIKVFDGYIQDVNTRQ